MDMAEGMAGKGAAQVTAGEGFWKVMTDHRLCIRRYRVPSAKLKGRVRAVFLSDLHGSCYGDGQRNLLEQVCKEQPDVVFFGGDMVDERMPEVNTDLVMKALGQRYSCYYVSGNHEFRRGRIREIKGRFRSYGVHILEGSCDSIVVNGSRINICGVDDVVAGKRLFGEQLARLESVCTFEAFTVLLAHRPELAARYLKSPYDLVLAGHAHGGQWRIPGRLNGLYAPHQGLFPRYAGGMYRFGDARMVVGRGLTCERPGIPRIFNPPEIVVLELEQKN